jgi:hypothetical protein
MAFDRENMGVLGYCNGFTVWYYRSSVDTSATITASGYFTPFHTALSPEDLIFFTDSLNRTGRRRVNSISSSLVTLAQLI